MTDDEKAEQQRELVRLIVAGHDDRQVARRLHCSVSTLQRMLGSVLRQYGLPNRAALGAFAASQGWLPDYPPPTVPSAMGREVR